MTISLGFGLITCQRHPGDPRSDTEIYSRLEIPGHALCPRAHWQSALAPSVTILAEGVAPRVRDLAGAAGD